MALAITAMPTPAETPATTATGVDLAAALDGGGGEEGWETATAGFEEEEEVEERVRGKKGGDKARHKREALLAQAYKQTGLAKLDAAVDYLLTLLEGGVDKVLVFAHHLQVLDGIEAAFASKEIKYVRIDGSVPPAKRQLAVTAFQTSTCQEKMVAILGITILKRSQTYSFQ